MFRALMTKTRVVTLMTKAIPFITADAISIGNTPLLISIIAEYFVFLQTRFWLP